MIKENFNNIEILKLLENTNKLAKIGVFQYSVKDDCIYWNDVMKEINEVQPSFKPNTENILSFFPNEKTKQLVEETLATAINEGKPFNIDHEIITAKGNSRHIWTLGHPIYKNEEVVQINGTSIDITARKNAELELAQKNKVLNFAEQMTNIGYWDWDTVINEETWSDNLYKIVGRKKGGKLTYETYLEYVHPEDLDFVVEQISKAFKTKVFHDFSHKIIVNTTEIKVVHLVGEVICNKQGEVIKMVGTCQDITKNKKREQIILQKNQQLNFAEKMAKIGNWEYNLINGKVTWSDNLYEIYGHDKSEPISYETYLNYVHTEDKDFVTKNVQLAFSKKELKNITYRIQLKNGTVKTIKSIGKVVLNNSGEVIGMQGTCQDITETKNRELELLKKQQQLSIAEEIAQMGHWEWNPNTDLFHWSDNLYRIFGLEVGIKLSMELLISRVHPDDKERIEKMAKDAIETKVLNKFSYRIIPPKGPIKTLEVMGQIIFDDHGEIDKFIGITQDITNHISIKNELITKNQNLQLAEEIAMIGFWQWNLEQDKFIWSDNLYKMFGYEIGSNITNELFFNRIHPEDKEEFQRNVYEFMETKIFKSFSYRIVLPDGTIKIIESLGHHIVQEALGEPKEISGVIQDITIRAQKEKELFKNNKLLYLSSKIAQIGYWHWKFDSDELFWSDNLYHLFELEVGQVITIDFLLTLVHPDDIDTLQNAMEEGIKTKDFKKFRHRRIGNNGAIRTLEITGEFIFNDKGEATELIGTSQDVTDSITKETELIEKNYALNFAEEIAKIGNWKMTLKDQNIIWSDYMYQIFEIEKGAILTPETSLSKIHPEDLEEVLKTREQIFKTKTFQKHRHRIINKDGSISTIEIIGKVILDKFGEVQEIRGTIQDITESIKREQEIQEKNQNLNIGEQMAMIGSWQWNPFTDEFKWSDNLYKIFGFELGTKISYELLETYVHPDDREKVFNLSKEFISTKKITKHSYRIVLKNGNVRDLETIGQAILDDHNNLIKFIGTVQDVTVRLQNEKVIIEKNQMLHLAEELSKIGSWKWNIVSGKLNWSDNLYRIFGYEIGFEISFNLYETHIHQDDVLFITKTIKKIINTKVFKKFTHRIKRKDGTIRSLEVIGEVIVNSNGEVIELLGSCQDITEQKNAQLKILEANKRLKNSTIELTATNKQLAEFNHITSHNLRSPVSNLNALMGLYKDPAHEDIREDLLDKFETVINHLTLTLDTLVETLKVKQLNNKVTQNLSFEQTLNKTKEILAAEIIQNQAIIKSDFASVSKISYNQTYLDSIFLNLLSNAMKYKSNDRIPEIEIVSKKVNDSIELSFKDNGLGIDLKKHGDKLFGLNKVFHRHPDAKGIGLYLTKAQVEAMGGSISAESEVNVGTTFTITLN